MLQGRLTHALRRIVLTINPWKDLPKPGPPFSSHFPWHARTRRTTHLEEKPAMAVNILRKRHRHDTAEAPEESTRPRRRFWPRGGAAPEHPGADVADRPQPGRHLRRRRTPVSNMIMGTAWAAVAILLLGMLLTLTGANAANAFVGHTLDTAGWLATPFDDVFPNPDPQDHRYLNWGLAAIVYFLLGKALSRIIRF
jgi:hypothetical protein